MIIKQFKKNKGFTVIELLITLFIMFSLLCISSSIVKNYKSISNSMDCKICSNNISNFILSSKQYCRKNQAAGKISVFGENKINFTSGTNIINGFILPKGFKVITINTKDGRVSIDDRGITGSACTIIYLDRKNKNHEITICVGTSYVDVKN